MYPTKTPRERLMVTYMGASYVEGLGKQKPPMVRSIGKYSFPINNNSGCACVDPNYLPAMFDEKMLKEFWVFMTGQTICEDGVFLCDIERFLSDNKDRFWD